MQPKTMTNASSINPCRQGHFRGQFAATPARPRLEAQILYEDLETGVRAKYLCDRLQTVFQPELALEAHWWRFDLLEHLGFHREVENAAVRADLVLLSAHGSKELPEAVGKSIKHWLKGSPDAPPALVVLLDKDHESSNKAHRVRSELAAAAHSVGAGFFFRSEEPADEELTIEKIQWRAETVTEVLAAPMRHCERFPRRHWGIND